MKYKKPENGRDVFLIDGSRTPFLKARGKPGPFTPVDLAVWAGRPLLLRHALRPQDIDEVILGCVNPHYDEVNPGRVAGLRLGCGVSTPGWTVQRNCGSGMQSVDTAFRTIQSGTADLILAGGTEALSHAPLIYKPGLVDWLAKWNRSNPWQKMKLSTQIKAEFFSPIIGLVHGLTDPICGLSMGQTAEILQYQFSVSREAADRYALSSHERLAAARKEGRLVEIEPMYADDGTCYEHDQGLRTDSTLENLAELKPVFEKPFGEVTAGNSSQVTDGACWLLLASEQAVNEFDLPVMARILDSEWAALPPDVMGLGPVFASTPLLQRWQLDLDDINAWEINEAFAAQVLACLQAWQNTDFCQQWLGMEQALGLIEPHKLNVDGGAISLGHPVGTSGARIVLHLLHVLQRRQGGYGIASECIGGGQGGAMLLEAA